MKDLLFERFLQRLIREKQKLKGEATNDREEIRLHKRKIKEYNTLVSKGRINQQDLEDAI